MLRSWCTHSRSSIMDLVVFFWATNRVGEPPPFTISAKPQRSGIRFYFNVSVMPLSYKLQSTVTSENWMFVIARQAIAKETAALCDSSTLINVCITFLEVCNSIYCVQGSWFFSPPRFCFLTQDKGTVLLRREKYDITRCDYMPIFPLQYWKQ